MAKFRITEWKDGAVFRTEHVETGWFAEDETTANRPSETEILFIAPSDKFSQENMTIRIKRN
jgi:hypothetical protein